MTFNQHGQLFHVNQSISSCLFLLLLLLPKTEKYFIILTKKNNNGLIIHSYCIIGFITYLYCEIFYPLFHLTLILLSYFFSFFLDEHSVQKNNQHFFSFLASDHCHYIFIPLYTHFLIFHIVFCMCRCFLFILAPELFLIINLPQPTIRDLSFGNQTLKFLKNVRRNFKYFQLTKY